PRALAPDPDDDGNGDPGDGADLAERYRGARRPDLLADGARGGGGAGVLDRRQPAVPADHLRDPRGPEHRHQARAEAGAGPAVGTGTRGRRVGRPDAGYADRVPSIRHPPGQTPSAVPRLVRKKFSSTLATRLRHQPRMDCTSTRRA